MSHNAAPTVSGTSISNTNRAVDALSALGPVERPEGIMLYPWTNSTFSYSSTGVRFTRFTTSRNLTIKTIKFIVSTQSSVSHTIQVGFYSSAGTRLITSGDTTPGTDSTGIKSVTLNGSTGYSLTAGTTYYAAIGYAHSGTGATVLANIPTTSTVPQMFGSGVGNADSFVQGGISALPADMSSAGNSSVAITFGLSIT